MIQNDRPYQLQFVSPNMESDVSTHGADEPISGLPNVINVSTEAFIKRLNLSDGRTLEVNRFACVGVGDQLVTRGGGALSVRTKDGDAVIFPDYTATTEFEVVPGKKLFLEIHEVSDQSLYEAYDALAQYHYRSRNSFGRRAILLLTCKDLDFPSVLGFIEITTAFMNAKNRSTLFNAPFEAEPGRNVKWTKWDKETRNTYINTIARISRMVVHPEVRGLGLSSILIKQAESFCRERWNINGRKALFLEITADMLKFMPFPRSAYMHWIGNSAGNIDRIEHDMRYLEAKRESKQEHWINRQTSRGIASQQRKDIDKIIALKKKFEEEGKDIFLQLSRVAEGDREVDAETYETLMPLVRYPKPTFMKGLTPRAEAFISDRCNELGLYRSERAAEREVTPCSSSLRVRNLSLVFHVDTGTLGSTGPGTVRHAFGLAREFKFRTGIRELSFEVNPGEICYVYGSSGSGKTCLLNLLSKPGEIEGVGTVTGNTFSPSDGRHGFLEYDWPSSPLLSAIGAKDLNEAVYALNIAGLAEPRLYLSQWEQLSAGQKYRAQLARLICSDSNIWILDEFASNLDDATALSVGRNFARAARRREVICIIASVRRTPLINALTPDIVLRLNQVGAVSVSREWETLGGTHYDN